MSESRSLFDTKFVKCALDLAKKSLKDQDGSLYYGEECPVRVYNSKFVLASALMAAERNRSKMDEFKCSDAYEIASNLGSTTSRQCYKDGYPPNMRAIAGIDCRDLEELWKSESHGMRPVSYLIYWIVLIFTKNSPDHYHVISSLLLEYVKENMVSKTHSALIWASKMPEFVRLQNGAWYAAKFKNATAKPHLAQVLFLSGKRKVKMIGVRMLTRTSRAFKVTEDFKYVESTEAVGAKCLKGLTFRTYTSICKCKCCTPPREAFYINRLMFCASNRVCCVGPAIKLLEVLNSC